MSAGIATLIRGVLGSAAAEQAMRQQALQLAEEHLREDEVRAALAECLAADPARPEDAEFRHTLELLAPYVSRDRGLRALLLGALDAIAAGQRRLWLLERIVPQLPPAEQPAPVLAALAREREPRRRAALLQLLRPLAVSRYPELAQAYAAELVDPASPLRQDAAAVLAPGAERHPAMVAALEDVLLHDQDRDLLRACLDAYRREGVARRFEPLLAVVERDSLDPVSRQDGLDALLALTLSADEQARLDGLLASLPPHTLKLRR